MATDPIPTDTIAARTQLIQLAAQKYALPMAVVLGICKTESQLDRWAMRFEPDYRYCWDSHAGKPYLVHAGDLHSCVAPADFRGCPGLSESVHTEWIGQRSSYGVMQVMGALAREMGFRGYFAQLSDVLTCCDVGCRHLIDLKGRYFAQHGWSGVYAAYNSGQALTGADGKFVDQEYVDRVISNGGPA